MGKQKVHITSLGLLHFLVTSGRYGMNPCDGLQPDSVTINLTLYRQSQSSISCLDEDSDLHTVTIFRMLSTRLQQFKLTNVGIEDAEVKVSSYVSAFSHCLQIPTKE